MEFKLDNILQAVGLLSQKVSHMSDSNAAAVATLQASATRAEAKIDTLITLAGEQAQKLRDLAATMQNSDDSAAILAIAADLDKHSDAADAFVAAQNPAPAPAPEQPAEPVAADASAS